MQTFITIGGVEYDGTASGWAAQGISGMEFQWDLEADWSFSFQVFRVCNVGMPYPAGSTIAVDVDDGSGRRPVFAGDLQRPQVSAGPTGYVWSYSATGLKARANYVTLSGLDGSGTASFNLAPDDPLSLYATSGQTVGDILRLLLCQVDNAAALNAAGVGAYTSMSPPTLPAATLADLAAMTIVPNVPVQLRGESILNTLEQFAMNWHPQYCSQVMPDGVIRYRPIFGLTPRAVALPANDGSGADVDWPNLTVDISECYTAWEIRGLDIQSAILSTVQGTLWGKGLGTAGSPKSGWTAAQESAYTIADFLQPKDATDDGALASVTSSSASVHSDYPKAHWVANYWNGANVQGWIWFFNLSATGIDIYEIRQITSCTALVAGGSATVTWDPGLPLNSTGYTRYRIVGQATAQSLVSRKFFVREPATGKTGTDTWIGSHLYPRNSRGMPVANNSRVFNVFYPYAEVWWSRTGAYPWWTAPVPVQIDPLDGSVVLSQPAVQLSSGFAGTTSALQYRYPASFADGLPSNVQVVVAYNRGGLSARAPTLGSGSGSTSTEPAGWEPPDWGAPGWLPGVGGGGGGGSADYSGTAYTRYGLERVKVHKVDTFNWVGDQPALQALAEEHLKTVQDAVVTGSLNFYELPTFDVFTPGFCLNISTADGATAVDGLDLPVMSATIRWHDSPDPVLYSASLRFNNRHRAFEADSLYLHPALGRGTFGMQGGESFGSEMMGMAMQAAGAMSQSRLAGALPAGQAPMGQAPMGQHPMGQDAGSNPIADAMAGFGQSPDFGGVGGVDDLGPSSSGRGGGRQPDRFLGPQEAARARQQQARHDRQDDHANPGSIMNMDLAAGAPIDVDAGANPKSIMDMRRPAGPGQKIDVSDPVTPLPAPWRKQRPPGNLARRRGDDDDAGDTTAGGGG